MATNVTLYKVLLLPAAKLYGYFAPIMAFANWSHAAETLVEEVEQTEANLQYAWVQYSGRWQDTVSRRDLAIMGTELGPTMVQGKELLIHAPRTSLTIPPPKGITRSYRAQNPHHVTLVPMKCQYPRNGLILILTFFFSKANGLSTKGESASGQISKTGWPSLRLHQNLKRNYQKDLLMMSHPYNPKGPVRWLVI